MEMLHADEYIACIKAGKKPKLALVGQLMVTDGMLTEAGKHFLVIDGMLYEVKPDFVLYAQWDEERINQASNPSNSPTE
jgi:hypothetical protein